MCQVIKISPGLLNFIKTKYGVTPNVDWYGAGGGSIYNIVTFLDNYHKIYDFIDFEFEYILKFLDHRFGWLDLYMQIAYFILGKFIRLITISLKYGRLPTSVTPTSLLFMHIRKLY